MRQHSKGAGYTLIEMVVSVAVFGTVVSIAAGVFVNSLRNQRAALALMAVNDNASLTIEQMAREIRIGGSFVVNPPPAGSRISLVNQRNQNVSYFYSEDLGPNPPSTRKGSIWRSVANPGSPAEELPLTSENVHIDRLTFELQGGGANRPSRIVIVMRVGSTNPFLKNVFTDVQTTITARGE